MGLLNGLSALGASTAAFAGTAGLEAQKASLAQQSLTLADQLATTRESAGRQEAGKIAAAAATQQQAATAALTATTEAGANTRSAAANATTIQTANIAGQTSRDVTAANNAAELFRMNNGDTPEMKLLRALGGLPPLPSGASGSGNAPVAPANPTGGQSGGGQLAATGSTPAPSTPASGTPAATSGVSPAASSDPAAGPTPLARSLINKTLGLPQPGSEDALRRGVAADVAADPDFANKTPGQQAMETEKRVAVASGKMTDPDARALMAQGIANYQISPLGGYALTKPGGPETMAQVMKINPDYQESRFPEVNKAMTAFGSGPQGNIIRANDVGFQHLAVIDQAAAALGNSNVGALNSVKNAFQTQFGAAAPTTFEGLKQIVATEIEKAVAGGIGSAADRDRLMQSLSSANSPAQLQAMTNGFRSLMVGQLNGLKTQYEQATGITSGPFAFDNKLAPETKAALAASHGSTTATTATPANRPPLADLLRPPTVNAPANPALQGLGGQ